MKRKGRKVKKFDEKWKCFYRIYLDLLLCYCNE